MNGLRNSEAKETDVIILGPRDYFGTMRFFEFSGFQLGKMFLKPKESPFCVY